MRGGGRALEISSAASGGRGRTWNGPAENAICWADVGTRRLNKKMVLLELLGCATYLWMRERYLHYNYTYLLN